MLELRTLRVHAVGVWPIPAGCITAGVGSRQFRLGIALERLCIAGLGTFNLQLCDLRELLANLGFRLLGLHSVLAVSHTKGLIHFDIWHGMLRFSLAGLGSYPFGSCHIFAGIGLSRSFYTDVWMR